MKISISHLEGILRLKNSVKHIKLPKDRLFEGNMKHKGQSTAVKQTSKVPEPTVMVDIQ